MRKRLIIQKNYFNNYNSTKPLFIFPFISFFVPKSYFITELSSTLLQMKFKFCKCIKIGIFPWPPETPEKGQNLDKWHAFLSINKLEANSATFCLLTVQWVGTFLIRFSKGSRGKNLEEIHDWLDKITLEQRLQHQSN